jgi:putative Holliday junction resolvase
MPPGRSKAAVVGAASSLLPGAKRSKGSIPRSSSCEGRSLGADSPACPTSRRDLRALGVDLGSRRIGLALSDSAGTLATPYEVVQRSGDEQRDHDRIRRLGDEADVSVIVVGLPLSLDGSEGPAARAVREEAARLAKVVAVPVESFDERLTTVSAERDLKAQNLGAKARRRVVDKVAAAVMLQAWLDAQRRGGRDPLL